MTRRNAIIIFLLSAVGFSASVYLTNLHQQIFTGQLEDFGFCGISREISCEAVSASPYSKIFGVPLAWLGTMLYLFWLVIAAFSAYKPERYSSSSTGLFLISAGSAVVANIYLGQLMFFTIGSLCLLCLLTYLINLLILILAISMAKGSLLPTCNAAIKAMLPFGGKTSFVFIVSFTLIISIGVIGHSRMQKAIDVASTFDEAGFRNYQQHFKRLSVDISNDPFHGAADARLTIIEFSDFQCSHCRKAHTILQTILPGYRDQVKLVFKNLPIGIQCNEDYRSRSNGHDLHPSACSLAQLGEAAQKQDAFWPLHDRIFQIQQELKGTAIEREALMQIGRDAGLDMSRLEKDYDDPATSQLILDDLAVSQKLGINGTPVFLFNGLLLEGMPSPSILKRIIELELELAASKN